MRDMGFGQFRDLSPDQRVLVLCRALLAIDAVQYVPTKMRRLNRVVGFPAGDSQSPPNVRVWLGKCTPRTACAVRPCRPTRPTSTPAQNPCRLQRRVKHSRPNRSEGATGATKVGQRLDSAKTGSGTRVHATCSAVRSHQLYSPQELSYPLSRFNVNRGTRVSIEGGWQHACWLAANGHKPPLLRSVHFQMQYYHGRLLYCPDL